MVYCQQVDSSQDHTVKTAVVGNMQYDQYKWPTKKDAQAQWELNISISQINSLKNVL